MRHAKSDWSEAGLADFDRPLNQRGQSDAPRVARFLAQACPPQLVLASAAVRARRTAEAVAQQLGSGAELLLDGQLYGADPSTLSQSLGRARQEAQTVLVVAHNPGLEDWLRQLTGARVHLPPGGVARVDSPAAAWAAVGREGGQLRWLVTPKLLKAMG